MENDPFDDALGQSLADYTAPIADDGFSEAVIARARREARLRSGLLLGACFFGGVIASTQIFKLGSLSGVFRGITPSMPDLSLNISAAFSGGYSAPLAAAIGAGFMIWLARELIDSHI